MNNVSISPLNFCAYTFQSQESDIFESLPSEIFIKILSDLDKTETKESRLVSRQWNVFLVEMAAHQELVTIKKYGKFLSENLKEFLKLPTVESESNILRSNSLSELHSSVLETKESFIFELKNFHETELKRIISLSGNETRPKCFQNILQLALIEKVLFKAGLVIGAEKEQTLYGASFSLLLMGEIDKSLDVAKGMQESLFRNIGLQEIFSICIEKGRLDQAFEVTQMMMEGRWGHKEEAIFEVFSAYTHRSEFEKALECIAAIPENFIPYQIHKMFNLTDENRGEILEFIRLIPHDGIKELCYATISK